MNDDELEPSDIITCSYYDKEHQEKKKVNIIISQFVIGILNSTYLILLLIIDFSFVDIY